MKQGLGMVEGNYLDGMVREELTKAKSIFKLRSQSQNISGRENSMFRSPAEMGYSKSSA